MSLGTTVARTLTGLTVAAVASTVGLAVATGSGASPATAAPGGPGPVTVTLTIEHSRFSPERIRVREHSTVRFVVRNRDPIGHELIVGDREVHLLHASGTHAQHDAVPGEVSVGPRETASTTYEFHARGPVVFACHLPGHFEYGMVGKVLVVR